MLTDGHEDIVHSETVVRGDETSHAVSVGCQSSAECTPRTQSMPLTSTLSKVDPVQDPHKLRK